MVTVRKHFSSDCFKCWRSKDNWKFRNFWPKDMLTCRSVDDLSLSCDPLQVMKSNDLHPEVQSISAWNSSPHSSICFCVSLCFFLQQKREDLLVRRSRRRSRLKVCLLGLVGPDPNSDQLLSEVQLHSKRPCENLQNSDRGGGGSGFRSGSGSGSRSVLALFTNPVKQTRKPDLRLAGWGWSTAHRFDLVSSWLFLPELLNFSSSENSDFFVTPEEPSVVPDKVTVPREVSPEAQQPRTEEPGQIRWKSRVPHPGHNAEDLKDKAAAEPLGSRGKILAWGINMFFKNIFCFMVELWSLGFSDYENVNLW